MKRMDVGRRLRELVLPFAKQAVFRAAQPRGVVRAAYGTAFRAGIYGREAMEWAHRAFIATPAFLSFCESHGERISVDRVPYVFGNPRIRLGNDVRISGQLHIVSSWSRDPEIEIGDGVFIAHNTSFSVGRKITIGKWVAIGQATHIMDSEGHNHYNPQRPIWEVPATEAEISPVTIEDGVQIGRGCLIMKGVTIGARSVVGARSVIRTSIPPDSVVMGNPARVIKTMRPGE